MRTPTIACSVIAIFATISAAAAGGPGSLCHKKGLTWGMQLPHPNAVTGTNSVGCLSTVGGKQCDPYVGDTYCKTALPLLCIHVDAAAFPVPTDVDNSSVYNGWAYGVMGTTKPIRPCQVATTIADANAICVAEFGAGWRVAEHHDGNATFGWGFQAFGGAGMPNKRVWMDINTTTGTCWTR